jgi:sugar phosphate isomerase/epimerase
LYYFLEEAAEMGVRNIELSGGTEYDEEHVAKLIEYKKRYTFNYTVHNYFPPPRDSFILNIAAAASTLREKSIAFAKNSIKLASAIGSDLYTIHAGYLTDLEISTCGQHFLPAEDTITNKEAAWKYFSLSVMELCAFAGEYSIRFGVENLFPYGRNKNYSLMCSSQDIDRAIEECKPFKNFGILLDLAHAKISSHLLGFSLESFLNEIVSHHKDRILGVHISDNDGVSDLHVLPPQKSWMTRFVINSELHAVPITIEARNDNHHNVISYCLFLNKELGYCHD